MKPLAIQGSLVDAKNVAAHKCMRLSIDVPAELGKTIIDTFGWPTMAEPVAVAVARLTTVAEKPAPEEKPRQKFSDLRPSAQAALRCRDESFWRFLSETSSSIVRDEQQAAERVRARCGVHSRSELDSKQACARLWQEINEGFEAWRIAAEHGATA